MDEMLEQLNEIMKAMADNEELMGNISRFLMRFMESLMKQGFTREEAVSIVTNFKATGS